ncbi:MAG TPA: hypothetical protein VLL50_05300 [Usitatibacter sp.]|nr:hypothetical protein [Usitatibacter sp.]
MRATNSAVAEGARVAKVPCHWLGSLLFMLEGSGAAVNWSVCVNATSGPPSISTHIFASPFTIATLRSESFSILFSAWMFHSHVCGSGAASESRTRMRSGRRKTIVRSA